MSHVSSAKDVTLAHILARGWYQNKENRINMLPESVSTLIQGIGIDSPANGMLLEPDHAAAFDRGYFAIRLNASNQYEVVAIRDRYLNHDGFLLYGGRRADDTALDIVPAMNGDLLKFHLNCAVLRNLKASAEPTDPWAQYNDDLEDIASQLEKHTNLSTETIKSGLSWWAVERVVNRRVDEPVSKPGLMDSVGGDLTDANTSGSSDE